MGGMILMIMFTILICGGVPYFAFTYMNRNAKTSEDKEKTNRKVNFFYGARSLKEAFYLEDYAQIEKEFPNFKFHLALDRPDPEADKAGVPYVAGFVHNVLYETYLKNHEAPEDILYLMCGPPMMAQSVVNLLDSLGVPSENILFDNFGG